MRKVVFGINITADGYCDHRDIIADDALHGYFARLLRSADLLLFGRITYELMVPYWPEVAKNRSGSKSVNEFARVFDSINKIVFSTTLNQIGGNGTRIVRADIAEEVLGLRQQPGKDIFVDGLSVGSQLADRGLIDEYYFVVHPVIAGKGPRLFNSVKLRERFRLDLIGSKTFRSGAVALRYKKHALG